MPTMAGAGFEPARADAKTLELNPGLSWVAETQSAEPSLLLSGICLSRELKSRELRIEPGTDMGSRSLNS